MSKFLGEREKERRGEGGTLHPPFGEACVLRPACESFHFRRKYFDGVWESQPATRRKNMIVRMHKMFYFFFSLNTHAFCLILQFLGKTRARMFQILHSRAEVYAR